MSLIDRLGSVLGDSVNAKFEVSHWLSTGFSPLNRIISGDYNRGMPVGRIVEMFGPSSCGKTAIATSVMAAAQQLGGFAMFNDHERSFDAAQGVNLGLDVESGTFAHLRPDTLEESFMIAMKSARELREKSMIDEASPIVAVFDSIAAMVPRSKAEKELDELTMADSLALAKALSTVLPTVKLYAEKYNILILALNQIRENPGVSYGDPTRTPGGKALPFYADARIKLSASKIVNKDKDPIGQRITAQAIKSKFTRPFQTTEWDFLFNEDGTGSFDATGSLIDHLKEVGKIEMSGAYFVYDGKKYHRSQLKEHIQSEGKLDELEALLTKE